MSDSIQIPTQEEQKVRNWAMALHLSQFAGHFTLLAGLVVPIIIWQVKKNEMPELDAHGKNIANWIISLVIYAAISGALIVVLIGFPLLAVLGVLSIVFPIIGAIKAGSGEVWRYPLSISFFK